MFMKQVSTLTISLTSRKFFQGNECCVHYCSTQSVLQCLTLDLHVIRSEKGSCFFRGSGRMLTAWVQKEKCQHTCNFKTSHNHHAPPVLLHQTHSTSEQGSWSFKLCLKDDWLHHEHVRFWYRGSIIHKVSSYKVGVITSNST